MHIPDNICPAPPDPRVTGLPAGVDTSLWLRLDSIVHDLYDSSGGILGAYVVRTRDSQLVWSRHPDLRTLPASTMKVLAAAAALEDLGPEFRWRTTVWATGPVVRGVLKGDLVLEGGGDPTLGVDGAGMGPFVNAVLRAGIKRVEGSIIALDTLVGRDEAVWPQGWSIGNSRDGYGAPVTGLNWGQNRTRYRSFPEPRKLALLTFSKSLRARKVAIDRTDTTVIARGDKMPDRRRWTLIARVHSPKLSEVLRICLVHSVNPYAEASVLALGTRRPHPKYAPRDQGRRRFRQILTFMGAPASVVADDGSGLSRMNLVTARAMAEMLRRDLLRADGLRVTDLMPRGGEGTIRFRFGRMPDPAWVSAKTGTLDGTSTLVGILRIPGRDTLAFALLSTGYQGSAKMVRGLQDRLLLSLAGIELTSPVDTLLSVPDSLEDAELPISLDAPAPVRPVRDTVLATPVRLDDTVSLPLAPPLDSLPTPVPQVDTTPSPLPAPDSSPACMRCPLLDSAARNTPPELPPADRAEPTDSAPQSTAPMPLESLPDSTPPTPDTLAPSDPPQPPVAPATTSDSGSSAPPPPEVPPLMDSAALPPEQPSQPATEGTEGPFPLAPKELEAPPPAEEGITPPSP